MKLPTLNSEFSITIITSVIGTLCWLWLSGGFSEHQRQLELREDLHARLLYYRSYSN